MRAASNVMPMRATAGTRLPSGKYCQAASTARAASTASARWCTPTISLGFDGFTDSSLSPVEMYSLPMRSRYSRPNSERTCRRASSMARRLAGWEKSAYGSLRNSIKVVHDQCHQRNQAADDGVPVKDAVLRTHAPVRPQRLKEIAVGLQRNAAHHVAQSGAEEDSQQDARNSKDDIEEALPHRVLNMGAELNADAAQHQQPQHHHQRQVKAAEAGRVQQRKGEVESPAGGQQPHFVAVPYRADGAQHHAALRIIFRDEEVDRARSDVEAVQQHVSGDHYRNNHEPQS